MRVRTHGLIFFSIRDLSIRFSLLLWLVLIASALMGCSVPNLEKAQCTAARETVKRFYSFHFGTEMSSTPENNKAREAFLTSDLIKTLSLTTETKRDYFTATENYPKAFRVGECSSDSVEKATLQVLLLWRDETKSEQKEVYVETELVDDKWLIKRVSN